MSEQIEAILGEAGFEHFGWAKLELPLSMSIYKEWLSEGCHGDMEYLVRHTPQKEDAAKLLAGAKSAISVARAYLPHPRPSEVLPGLEVALYARGEDYHHWFKSELEKVASRLRELFVGEEFFCSTDSAPVLERDLAYRAGLGWIGKNTCLIDQKRGSFFFVGQILTTMPVESLSGEIASLAVAADRCGTCTRCLDACPTGALVEPRKLDARKCISYLTIEAKSVPALEYREAIGTNYYGCDICQTVCPWNQKVLAANGLGAKAGENDIATGEEPRRRDETIRDLRTVLTSSGRQLEKLFAGTPLERATTKHHRANAIIVAANLKLHELENDIAQAGEKDERLKKLSEWALSKFE